MFSMKENGKKFTGDWMWMKMASSVEKTFTKSWEWYLTLVVTTNSTLCWLILALPTSFGNTWYHSFLCHISRHINNIRSMKWVQTDLNTIRLSPKKLKTPRPRPVTLHLLRILTGLLFLGNSANLNLASIWTEAGLAGLTATDLRKILSNAYFATRSLRLLSLSIEFGNFDILMKIEIDWIDDETNV